MFFSPLQVLVSEAAPALPADRQFLSFEENVEFNVVASAVVLPGVLTTFQTIQLQLARA